jgi:hypothetical protein
VPVRRGDVCEGVRREESGQHEERRRGVDGVDVTGHKEGVDRRRPRLCVRRIISAAQLLFFGNDGAERCSFAITASDATSATAAAKAYALTCASGAGAKTARGAAGAGAKTPEQVMPPGWCPMLHSHCSTGVLDTNMRAYFHRCPDDGRHCVAAQQTFIRKHIKHSYMHVYIHKHRYKIAHSRSHTLFQSYIHVCRGLHTHMHTRACKYIACVCTHTHRHAGAHTNEHPSTNTHVRAHTKTQIHAHTKTQIHAHTHTHSLSLSHTHTLTHKHEHTHTHIGTYMSHSVTHNMSKYTLLLRQRHKHMIAGDGAAGLSGVLVVLAPVVKQKVAGELEKIQKRRGGAGGCGGAGVWIDFRGKGVGVRRI